MAKRPSNKFILKAIRANMVPALKEMGFEGTYPKFKRTTDTELHFLEIAAVKYGGAFSYSVGWCANGPLTHWDGDIIPPDEIEMAHLPFENRASAHRMIDQWRLDGTKLRCSDGAFEYSLIVEDEALCRDLVCEAAKTLPQADAWLRTRETQDAIWSNGKTPPVGWDPKLTAQMSINKNELRVKALGLLD